MPQMLRLSQGHWLNLDTIVEVADQHTRLVVECATAIEDEHGHYVPYSLHLTGEERERLLAWLNTHSVYMSTPRADNDDENPPF